MHHQINGKGTQMVDVEFETAVEIVKAQAHNGLLLDGLEYIQECIHSGDGDMVSFEAIKAYHFVCHKMRPLFLPPNE